MKRVPTSSRQVSKKETTPQEMQGLSLHGSEAKIFQKRNKTPRNARAKAFVEAKPNCFKKETKPQEMLGLSLRENEVKLF
jgi:hypothetical protein